MGEQTIEQADIRIDTDAHIYWASAVYLSAEERTNGEAGWEVVSGTDEWDNDGNGIVYATRMQALSAALVDLLHDIQEAKAAQA